MLHTLLSHAVVVAATAAAIIAVVVEEEKEDVCSSITVGDQWYRTSNGRVRPKIY